MAEDNGSRFASSGDHGEEGRVLRCWSHHWHFDRWTRSKWSLLRPLEAQKVSALANLLLSRLQIWFYQEHL